MARNYIYDLVTLSKTSVDSNHFLETSNSVSTFSNKISIATLFPSLVNAGSGSEDIFVSVTNKNQLNFKGIKSGDTGVLTVATTSNNIVLTALEAGIDLSLCNNLTSGFVTGPDFTTTVTGECAVINGGTGLSTLAKGSVLYADNTDSIAAATPSAQGQILAHNTTTGIPAWITLTGGTNTSVVNTAGVITINSTLATMAADLDMANYDIDLGTGYLSSDGASNGIRVTGNNAYIGASGSYINTGALNIDGGDIIFTSDTSPTIKPTATSGSTTGMALDLESGGSVNGVSGELTIKGGDASGSGAAGHVTIEAGKSASGTDGSIRLKTYTSTSAITAITVAPEGQDVTIDTGNLIMSSKGVYMRNSAYPTVIRHQPAPATTDDGTAVVSVANILTGIVECTPTGDRSKATDTAANLIASLQLGVNGDSFDFSFISLATDGASHVTLTAGAAVTLVGCMVISAQDLAQDAFTSGVAQFRIRRTSGSAVTMYRIA